MTSTNFERLEKRLIIKMGKRVKIFLFWSLLSVCTFFLTKSILGDVVLKKYGVCKSAILIDEVFGVKSHRPTLWFKFTIGDKVYQGNALEENLQMVGDTICIVYFKLFPTVSRPVKYFRENICNCK